MRSVIDKIFTRLNSLVVRALVLATNDTGAIQKLKVALRAGEISEVERLQTYGLSSNPASAEVLVICPGGSVEQGIAIACDSGASRPTDLVAGEVALYAAIGQTILLKADRSISITAAAGVDVGGGSDAVAMAVPTDAIKTALVTAASGAVCGSPGAACPFATAVATVLSALTTVASSNLRGD